MPYTTNKNLYVSEPDLCVWEEARTWAKENKTSMSALVAALLAEHMARQGRPVRCLRPDNGHSH